VGSTFAPDGLEAPLRAVVAGIVGLPVAVRHWVPYGGLLAFLATGVAAEDSAAAAAAAAAGAAVVFARVEDFAVAHPELLVDAKRDDVAALLRGPCVARLGAFCRALGACAASGRVGRVVLVVCPASARVAVDLGLGEAVRTLEVALCTSAEARGIACAVAAHELGLSPDARVDGDVDVDVRVHVDVDGPAGIREASHVPYDATGHAACAVAACRALHRALLLPTLKVLCLDCDGTLWEGACGDVGPEGVSFGAGHLAVQAAAVRAHARGVLVAVVSRNADEGVVRAVFDTRRAEMRLGWDVHVVAAKVALWRRKSDAVVELARELNLGLDAIAFVDDSPVECAEVAAALGPEGVQTLLLPRDPDRYAAALAGWWPLDPPPPQASSASASVTAEDATRTAMYRAEALRRAERQRAASGTAFLASLSLRIDVEVLGRPGAPGEGDAIARVAQLTERTNQFVTCKVPLSESQVAALAGAPGKDVLVSRVTDRFGHYGLVCAAMAAGACDIPGEAPALEVPLFLMSCRVLHRGVEHAMVRRLADIALRRGLGALAFRFVPTPRNVLAERFLRVLPGVRFRSPGGDPLDVPPVLEEGEEGRVGVPLWAIVLADNAARFDIEADAVMTEDDAGNPGGTPPPLARAPTPEREVEGEGEGDRTARMVAAGRGWLHWETYAALASASASSDRGLPGLVAEGLRGVAEPGVEVDGDVAEVEVEVDPFRAILGEDGDDGVLADAQGRARLRRQARHAVKGMVTQANAGHAGFVAPIPPPGSGDKYI